MGTASWRKPYAQLYVHTFLCVLLRTKLRRIPSVGRPSASRPSASRPSGSFYIIAWCDARMSSSSTDVPPCGDSSPPRLPLTVCKAALNVLLSKVWRQMSPALEAPLLRASSPTSDSRIAPGLLLVMGTDSSDGCIPREIRAVSHVTQSSLVGMAKQSCQWSKDIVYLHRKLTW